MDSNVIRAVPRSESEHPPPWIPQYVRVRMEHPDAWGLWDRTVKVSWWRITLQCLACGDWNKIHFSTKGAKKCGFGGIVAPASLIANMITTLLPEYRRLVRSDLRIINTELRYNPRRPVRRGESVVGHMRVGSWEIVGKRVILYVEIEVALAGRAGSLEETPAGTAKVLVGSLKLSIQEK